MVGVGARVEVVMSERICAERERQPATLWFWRAELCDAPVSQSLTSGLAELDPPVSQSATLHVGCFHASFRFYRPGDAGLRRELAPLPAGAQAHHHRRGD